MGRRSGKKTVENVAFLHKSKCIRCSAECSQMQVEKKFTRINRLNFQPGEGVCVCMGRVVLLLRQQVTDTLA